jgi:hypothetical protein
MSWLVRCWEEPREQPPDEPVLRYMVRDLKTGEERYLSDPRELGELVSRPVLEGRADETPQKKNPRSGG